MAVVGNPALSGYPQPVGEKYEKVFDHQGPASYNNTGTFATSGETITAISLGFGGLDTLGASGLSASGLYTAMVFLVNAGNANAVKSAVIHWFVQATGAEVANAVNLSGEVIRFTARLV